MNEPLFKNSFIRDDVAIKEMYKDYFLKSTRFRIIYAVCILLQLFSISADLGFFLTILFYNAIVLILVAFSYRQHVKISIARDREISNGEDILMDTSVFDDRIEVDIIDKNHKLYWDSVDYVSISENYVSIRTKAKLIYMLKKDSFTLGSCDDFIEFLKSKGLKIRK